MPPDDPRTDDQLVAAINRGDASAFDALYYRYRDWVARLAGRLTGHADDALDVVQETFTYLYRKFPGFVLTARMTTFLYPVVRHLALAVRDKRRRVGGNLDGQDTIPAAGSPAESADDLLSLLASLADGQREVLLLRFVDGLSLDEIAEALGIPLGTVKSRLHNALALLREDPRTRKYFENS